jgi:hypothetical protein
VGSNQPKESSDLDRQCQKKFAYNEGFQAAMNANVIYMPDIEGVTTGIKRNRN